MASLILLSFLKARAITKYKLFLYLGSMDRVSSNYWIPKENSLLLIKLIPKKYRASEQVLLNFTYFLSKSMDFSNWLFL